MTTPTHDRTDTNGPSPTTGRGYVLIIDDEPDYARFVAEVVSLSGHEARIVSDATGLAGSMLDDALLIVLDLSMPGLPGTEVMALLGERGSEVPVILVSGFDTNLLEASASLGRRRGANVVATASKPLRAATLKSLLEQAASGRVGGDAGRNINSP